MFDQEKAQLENAIIAYCEANDIPLVTPLEWRNIPFSGEWGTSTSFFQTAAAEARAGKAVKVPARAQEIAQALAEHLGIPTGFSRVEALNGYLNLTLNSAEFSRRVIDTTLTQAGDFGRGTAKGERVMVEFSQPNTHKALHVGHLRNMMLGAALANILEFAGYEVVRANYIGDFGKDVMKWMWNYRKHHMGEEPPAADKTRWMGDKYAEASKHLEEDPEGEAEIKAMFAQWEANDPEIHDLWKMTRQWSLDGFSEVYEQMGIHFDRIYYESEMEEPGKAYVKGLIERGIAVDERPEGPVLVKIDEILGLEKEQFKVALILRSDSTALYATWDLALAQRKIEDYNLDRSIYVVDVRQSFHFQQVFKILEIAGYEQISKAEHLPYEVVNLPGNITMKSREGTIVLLEDFIREAFKRAREVSVESNPDLDDETRDAVAHAVALGAIKYPLIARDNTKIATFDWETALDFNGQAAPYIQYAHVRATSLLRKAGVELPASLTPSHALEEKEVELIEALSQFPEDVQKGAADLKTLQVTNSAYGIAKAFNEFYNACPVNQAEGDVRAARLRLVAAAKQALANALWMLGIEAPEVM